MPLNQTLHVTDSIRIGATRDAVWNALTDPRLIKQYLFGAETITDWKIGSEILFQGEFNGQRWQDKGRVVEIDRNSVLRYSYWSGFCGLPDLPENYGTVTYSLKEDGGETLLNVTQQGYASEASQQSSAAGWRNILMQIKALVEKPAA